MVNKIAVFYDNLEFKNRIEYVFNYIFSHYFVKSQNFKIDFNPDYIDNSYIKVIYYQEKKPNNQDVYIRPQYMIFSNNELNIEALTYNVYHYSDLLLYSLEKYKIESDFFVKDKIINFDIIEMIFFHISRYEEYFAKENQHDHHERMKSSEQYLVKHGLYKIPVVDHVVYAFLDSLKLSELDIKSIYSITHDIDAIKKFPSFYKFLRAFARILKKEKITIKFYYLIKQYIISLIFNNDPYDTFDWLLRSNMSEEKIIYFMSGGKTKFDNFYSIYDEKLDFIINLAKKNNYIIGLHPSYATSFDKEQFNKEIEILSNRVGYKIINTRQHILHFCFQKTMDILEELNIKYDSTLGYQDLIGFRCGTGHNYYLYNFNKEKCSTVQEIPLVVMDGPLLMESSYDKKKSEKNILDFLHKNKKYTKITFNFHNSTFDDLVCSANGLKDIYFKINQVIGLK